MGHSKEQVIDVIGGFEFGEIEAGTSLRIRKILTLEEKIRTGGMPLEQVDNALDELRKLKGLPSSEFDYEARD
ncbi:MAG: hypothetical protein ACYCPO_14785 [Acidobacteriaceae bacterium]